MERETKVYISGKITGDKNFQKHFDEAAYALTVDGYSVINPACIRLVIGHKAGYRELMRFAIDALMTADAIYMLDGWKDSPGATAEHYLAKALGLEIMYEAPRHSDDG